LHPGENAAGIFRHFFQQFSGVSGIFSATFLGDFRAFWCLGLICPSARGVGTYLSKIQVGRSPGLGIPPPPVRAAPPHLLAISGLHVGIVAFVSYLFFNLLFFFGPWLWCREFSKKII